ncbi:hypothetical protein EI94DRAFT_1860546 [Lactarius quietus]|nr:hypothetical protein EI94DRAFT_1860546 [Lactarius quietus]
MLNISSVNYLNTSAPPSTFYARKHDGLIIYDLISAKETPRLNIRNFNDFAVDVNASAISQRIRVTPNMVDDGHDTTIDYAPSCSISGSSHCSTTTTSTTIVH